MNAARFLLAFKHRATAHPFRMLSRHTARPYSITSPHTEHIFRIALRHTAQVSSVDQVHCSSAPFGAVARSVMPGRRSATRFTRNAWVGPLPLLLLPPTTPLLCIPFTLPSPSPCKGHRPGSPRAWRPRTSVQTMPGFHPRLNAPASLVPGRASPTQHVTTALRPGGARSNTLTPRRQLFADGCLTAATGHS